VDSSLVPHTHTPSSFVLSLGDRDRSNLLLLVKGGAARIGREERGERKRSEYTSKRWLSTTAVAASRAVLRSRRDLLRSIPSGRDQEPS